MVVRFARPVPEPELRLPGIEIIEQGGTRVVLLVTGELNPLLQVLARHPVRQLSLPEPSLEEAFLEFYRGDERGRQ
jgi:ABC-2 type transport system ATP-binding protein